MYMESLFIWNYYIYQRIVITTLLKMNDYFSFLRITIHKERLFFVIKHNQIKE